VVLADDSAESGEWLCAKLGSIAGQNQLIPEQRDLLRTLPAFHRVLIEGVHHVPGPFPCRGTTRQVLPGNDPRDDPRAG